MDVGIHPRISAKQRVTRPRIDYNTWGNPRERGIQQPTRRVYKKTENVADKPLPLIQNPRANNSYSSYRELKVRLSEVEAYMAPFFQPKTGLKEFYDTLLKEADDAGVFFWSERPPLRALIPTPACQNPLNGAILKGSLLKGVQKKEVAKMRFRPCIDLHQGVVKQIIGSTLSEEKGDCLVTNFSSERPSSWYADLYRRDNLTGGHVIQLGAGNVPAARKALTAWPGGLQIGGGINDENAEEWLESGAESVIVTSYIFKNGTVNRENLGKLVRRVGKERLVLDLSCRKKEGVYWIVTDRWRKFTSTPITVETLDYFSRFCKEFLIHAVDVEGKNSGIEETLLRILGQWGKIPITYAGGVRSWNDIDTIRRLGNGRIDFTVGSALDLFGGEHLSYRDLVDTMKRENA